MSKIAAPFFEHSDVMVYPLFALILFIAVFLMVSLRAISLSKDEVDARSNLIFDSEETS